jgi:hypothetical protein
MKALQHFVKDMAIALEEAQRMQLALPGLALAQQLYTALIAQGSGSPPLLLSSKRLTRFSICCCKGHGKKGTQSLVLALRTLNGMAPS